MRRKTTLKLLYEAKTAEPVSTFSAEEEARLIGLADIALHKQASKTSPVAGVHARQEHESLKRAMKGALEKIRDHKGDAA